MNKKLYVFEDGLHEYTIIDKETTKGREISLWYSEAEHWTSHTRGTLILTMLVTGNGVKFSKSTKSLDYGELHEMRLLMNYERETDSFILNRGKSQIYDVTENNEDNKILNL
jgi:hypothetical protein